MQAWVYIYYFVGLLLYCGGVDSTLSSSSSRLMSISVVCSVVMALIIGIGWTGYNVCSNRPCGDRTHRVVLEYSNAPTKGTEENVCIVLALLYSEVIPKCTVLELNQPETPL